MVPLHVSTDHVSKQLLAAIAVGCICTSANANSKGFGPNDAHQNFFVSLVVDEHNVRATSAKDAV